MAFIKDKIIAIDFDGTVVKHAYPIVGKDIGAVPILKKLIQNNNKIILWTMRSGQELMDAVEWYQINNIPLFGININPEQKQWTTSRKAYAHLYIDDLSLGCPLKKEGFVDWDAIDFLLQNFDN